MPAGPRTLGAGPAVSSPGSSSRASGLPRVSTMSRRVTSSAGASPRWTSRRARAASGSRPVSASSTSPCGSKFSQAPSRAANTIATRSAPEPACAEQEGPRGGGIQPMGVVDDAQHDVLLGRGRQQRQGGHAHQERLHRRPVVLPERHSQRPGLRTGELLPQPRQGPQQTVERRERQRRLDLEPLRAQHRRVSGLDDELVQQGRLPHTRLAAHHQAAGRSVSRLARRARPGVPVRAHGPPARHERTRSPTHRSRRNPAL